MLSNENYLHETHTIQISTCKRFLSICFDTREILQFVDTDHLLTDIPIIFEPDYYDKIRISIENIHIELPDEGVKKFYQRIPQLSVKHTILESNSPTNFSQLELGCINASNLPSTYRNTSITSADTYVSAMTNNLKTSPTTPTPTLTKILIKPPF